MSGQLADIYGRHFALQFEMFWIMIGSILCASAQSWSMLLVGRALQGLGAAGIMNLSRIILSDGTTLCCLFWGEEFDMASCWIFGGCVIVIVHAILKFMR